MLPAQSPLTRLSKALANGTATPSSVVANVLAKANGNVSRNSYLELDEHALRQQAADLQAQTERGALWAVPISLKDCFDLAGTRTSCGAHFYARQSPAARDSAMAASLRRAGALISGKTHLHPLAYGITGENPDYGDCVQPRNPALLTGGSSSGAAASVQEGSALAAIGTDTGGSIRVPAALCGLTGYRASHCMPSLWWPEAWNGAVHLAPSFDTLGFVLHDPRDASQIATALFGVPTGSAPASPRIGCVPQTFLSDCEPGVLAALKRWKQELTAGGARVEVFDALDWADTIEIFAGIQAHEAAQIHAGHYDHFEPTIADRLRWGSSISTAELESLRIRRESFHASIRRLLERFDFLMLPCASISHLAARADHSSARPRILRYTTPFSLAGLPVISLPGEILGAPLGTGIQLAAAPGADSSLLDYGKRIGDRIAATDIG